MPKAKEEEAPSSYFRSLEHQGTDYIYFTARVRKIFKGNPFAVQPFGVRVQLDLDWDLLPSKVKAHSIIAVVPPLLAYSPLVVYEFIVTRAEGKQTAEKLEESLVPGKPILTVTEAWPTGFCVRTRLDDAALTLLFENYTDCKRVHGKMSVCKDMVSKIEMEKGASDGADSKKVKRVFACLLHKELRDSLLAHGLHGAGSRSYRKHTILSKFNGLMAEEVYDDDEDQAAFFKDVTESPLKAVCNNFADGGAYTLARVTQRLLQFPLLRVNPRIHPFNAVAFRERKTDFGSFSKITQGPVTDALVAYQVSWRRANVLATIGRNETVHAVAADNDSDMKCVKLLHDCGIVDYVSFFEDLETGMVLYVLKSTEATARRVCKRLREETTTVFVKSLDLLWKIVRSTDSNFFVASNSYRPALELLLLGEKGSQRLVDTWSSATEIHSHKYSELAWALIGVDKMPFCQIAKLFAGDRVLPRYVYIVDDRAKGGEEAEPADPFLRQLYSDHKKTSSSSSFGGLCPSG